MSDLDHDRLRTRLEGLFREELHDNLRVLTDGLRWFEAPPTDEDTDLRVQELFRAAHSLKGAAHAAGVSAAVEPCRRLEERLAALRAGDVGIDDELVTAVGADVAALAALQDELAAVAPSSGHGDAAAAAGEVAAPLSAPRTRVAVEALDELVRDAGALISVSEQLHTLTASLLDARDAAAGRGPAAGGDGDLEAVLHRAAVEAGTVQRRLADAAGRVTGTAQRLRMHPLGEVVAGLGHSVRELCRTTGKQAQLELQGELVEVDRDVAEALREPLLHLIRNAVDHGIEAPDQRARVGKVATGTVAVRVDLHGSRVLVTVSDDGAGVPLDSLRAAAGMEQEDSEEVLELAFLPGVSTATTVTDVSGRGVGLDAVRARVESLGGSVHLRTRIGAGTDVVLNVPTTLAVVEVVVVSVGGEVVALPASSIERFHRVDRADIDAVEGRLVVLGRLGGRPGVELGRALGLPDRDGDAPVATVVELADEDAVLLVDRVELELQTLLHPLPSRVAASTLLLGAVVLPGERVAPVASPAACLRAAATVLLPPTATVTGRQTVLLVEDTLTTRALEHSILEGAGYVVIDAVDGAEAWQLLADRPVDLVVSDVDMPRMGGIELCRAIRSSPRLGHLPVVLVTSLASDDDRRQGLEAGANAYLVKSTFDQATLLDAVRRLL